MAGDSGGADQESPVDRRELERIAFARPRTDADAAAAETAQRRLVDEDQDLPPAARTRAPVDDAPGADDETTELEPAVALPRARRGVMPALIALGLLIGLGTGVVIGRATATAATSLPRGARTFSATVPGAAGRGDSTAAATKLATAQTSADVFPVPAFSVSLGLEPKTVHLILTNPDGNSLWIGRTSAAICLLFSDPEAARTNDDLDPSLAGAGSSCAAPEAFEASGLTVRNGPDTWSWNGETFTETSTG